MPKYNYVVVDKPYIFCVQIYISAEFPNKTLLEDVCLESNLWGTRIYIYIYIGSEKCHYAGEERENHFHNPRLTVNPYIDPNDVFYFARKTLNSNTAYEIRVKRKYCVHDMKQKQKSKSVYKLYCIPISVAFVYSERLTVEKTEEYYIAYLNAFEMIPYTIEFRCYIIKLKLLICYSPLRCFTY